MTYKTNTGGLMEFGYTEPEQDIEFNEKIEKSYKKHKLRKDLKLLEKELEDFSNNLSLGIILIIAGIIFIFFNRYLIGLGFILIGLILFKSNYSKSKEIKTKKFKIEEKIKEI